MQSGTKKVRSRGRPREFDVDAALDGATAVFWARGLAATTLDDLARAMDMRRPSIANAFGDKQTLYRKALERFADRMMADVGALLSSEPTVQRALTAFYYAALDVYFASEPALGCFVMCTAPVEAASHRPVREDLERLIGEIDGLLAERFERAKRDGDLPPTTDAQSAAKLSQAILHSLAIRARAGASKTSLRKLARAAVEVLAP